MAPTILSASSTRSYISPTKIHFSRYPPSPSANPNFHQVPVSLTISCLLRPENHRRVVVASASVASPICVPPQKPLTVDKSGLVFEEAFSEEELWAASCLRIRCFNNFNNDTYGIEDHKRYLAEREFEALKERVASLNKGFRKVSCINASIPLSQISSLSDDLCNKCKFSVDGEDRIVVGSLDVNNCLRLPDEIVGMKPEGIGADFARAYISNVCVAKELQRNGLGYELILKARDVAEKWGMTDLYVHVAVDNEPAKKLYLKSGFIQESVEPAWQARFLNRPQRIILWMGLRDPYNL